MDGHTLKISEGVGARRDAISEDGGQVYSSVLDLHVRGSGGTHVAAGAGERHPWRRGVDAVRMTSIHRAVNQVIRVIPAQVGPVSESGLGHGCAGGRVFQVAVGG